MVSFMKIPKKFALKARDKQATQGNIWRPNIAKKEKIARYKKKENVMIY